MAGFYTYLISTLPTLEFSGKPPLTFENLVDLAARFLSDNELLILKKIPLWLEVSSDNAPHVYKKWLKFEVALRNELVKARASRKHLDSEKYLRNYESSETILAFVCASAMRHASPLEAEKTLDLERWRFLDELSIGHYFDLDILIIYGLKLLILERWEKIKKADSTKLMEAAIANL